MSKSLLLYYKLNDVDVTTTIVDSSSNGIGATAAQNTNVLTTTGKVGSAITFNGTTDKLTCTTNVIDTGNISVACWFNAVGYGGSNLGRIVDNGQFLLFFNSSKITLTGNAGVDIHQTGVLDLDTIYHVVATRNASGSSYLYVNGDVIGGAGTVNSGAGGTLYVGNRADNGRGWNGWLDDLRIYSEVLDSNSVRALWNDNRGTEKLYPWYKRRIISV